MIKIPNFVLFVSFVVKTFFLIWLRLCRARIFVVNEIKVASSFPQAFRQRQTGEIFSRESLLGLDTETLEHGDYLPRVLRGVPGGALEKLVHRRRAVEGFHRLPAGFVLELAPPALKPLNDAVTVAGNFLCGDAGSVCGWNVGIIGPVFYIVNGGFEESFADAKNVVAQEPNRAITIIDRPLGQPVAGELTNVALRRAQHSDPFRHQRSRRERRMPAALQADELGDIFQVLAKDVLITAR
jgi:hypothetical protein